MEVSQLQVVSIDATTGGLLRIRVATPAGSDVVISSENLAVTVAGETSEALVIPSETASLSVSLVIDTSESMSGEAIASAKEAAAVFVRSIPDEAQLSVVGFGSQATVVQSQSNDREAAIAAIESLEATGETSLYDGMLAGVGALGAADRQAVVVLSDGGDTVSLASLPEALQAVQASSVEVVAVALETDESNNDSLEQLASAGNGPVVSTDDPEALQEIYRDLASKLSSEYEIQIPIEATGLAPVSLEVKDEASDTTLTWADNVALTSSELGFIEMEQPPPNVVQVPAPQFSGSAMIWLGAFLFCASVAMVAAVVATWSPAPAKPQDRLTYVKPGSNISALRELRSTASLAIEGAVADSDTKADISAKLEAAGLKIRSGEFILASLASVTLFTFVGASMFGYVGGIVASAFGYIFPRFVVRFLANRRKKRFAKQLPDLLSALANTLKVGYSLPQALGVVAGEAEEPAQSEMKRALLEARVGGSLISSLGTSATRIGSDDLGWVVDAIEINSSIGGDLAEVLERVAETIRARTRLKAQIASLTAEAKMSAGVLFALPPGLAVMIFIMNPTYFDGVFDVGLGFVMLGLAVFLLGAGGAWLKKMIAAVAPS